MGCSACRTIDAGSVDGSRSVKSPKSSYHIDMETNSVLCTLAVPAVEVVTVRTDDGKVETMLNGGQLDGERFVGDGIPATCTGALAGWRERRRAFQALPSRLRRLGKTSVATTTAFGHKAALFGIPPIDQKCVSPSFSAVCSGYPRNRVDVIFKLKVPCSTS